MRADADAAHDPAVRQASIIVAVLVLGGCGTGAAASGAPPTNEVAATAATTTTVTATTSTTSTTSTTIAPTTTTEGTTADRPAPRGTVIEYAEPGQQWSTSITGWNPDATTLVKKADRYGLNKVEPGMVFAIVTVRTTHVSGNPAQSPISYRLQVAGPSAIAADLDIGCTISINRQATLNATVLDGGSVDEQICYQLTPTDAAAPVALISGGDGVPIYLALT